MKQEKEKIIAIAIATALLVGFVVLVWFLVHDGNSGAPHTETSKAADHVTVGTAIDGEEVRFGSEGPETAYRDDEEAIFEVLVQLQDQPGSDAFALKRGDVIAVRKSPYLWSETEKKSYLILRMKMLGKEANALLAPKVHGKAIERARARAIDLAKLRFEGTAVLDGQPFSKDVYDMSITKDL